MQIDRVIKPKLLINISTRVDTCTQELVDSVAEQNGLDRAKWMREAIDLKLQIDLGQSSVEELKKSKNTTYSSEYRNVFKNLLSVFQISKKPEIAARAFSVH